MNNNNKEQGLFPMVKGNIAIMAENKLIKIANMLSNARHKKEVFSICEITSLFNLLDVFRVEDNEQDGFYLMSGRQIGYNKIYRALHCSEIYFFTDESYQEIVESIIDYFEISGDLGSKVFGSRKDEILEEYMRIAYSNPELGEGEISNLLVGIDELLEEELKNNQVASKNKEVDLSARDLIFLIVLSIFTGGLMVKLIDAINNSSVFERIFG
ncbi:hypothetical protein [Aeromonas sp. MrichA-1]|uniref:hypothetical protein n=1 Tax=Aeromonas sp. MrichA-1 TaxID=2823362 RepID=UPI001B32E679|nr:hypothetical protein [Aeromonas sp. MrichA-1]MBP4081671.1 hypothetical protein [Aeromonas sp. MrichA-1]